jgi:hypothetical protein
MELRGNKVNAERLGKTLTSAGINVKAITSLGTYVHIDSYQKYEQQIVQYLVGSGFKLIKADDIYHLDGYAGYRASFKLES